MFVVNNRSMIYWLFMVLYVFNCFFLLFIISMVLPNACQPKKVEVHHVPVIEVRNLPIKEELDSVVVDSFLRNSKLAVSLQHEFRQFYQNRAYKYAWLNQQGVHPSVHVFYQQLQRYVSNFDDTTFNVDEVNGQMYFVSNYYCSQQVTNEIELFITSVYFNFIERAYRGRVENPRLLHWYIPRKKLDYQNLIGQAIVAKTETDIQEPCGKLYIKLREKLIYYRQIQQNGGLPLVKIRNEKLVQGNQDTGLITLKQYLFLSNDLPIKDASELFTPELSTALKKFQRRMGIVANGRIDKSTLLLLQIPVDSLINQLLVNLERLKWMPVSLGVNYVRINIPAFRLQLVDRGKLIWKSKIVVGKTITPTNIFKNNISQITFNPYWVIPTSIIRKEIVPEARLDPNFMVENNMEVLSGSRVVDLNSIDWFSYKGDGPFLIRQKPGLNNSLGKMIFLFPNPFHIYLHDTPVKSLFEENERAFSHGCIRLQNPIKLARYLLKDNPRWSAEKIDTILASNKNVKVVLLKKMPVYIVYFTAWVDHEGQLHFRKDLYGLDATLLLAMKQHSK